MKVTKSFTVFSILLFFLGSFCFAKEPVDFIAHLESINTMSGAFKQTITDADGEEVADPTEGKFHLKRPGKFYWETSPPFEQVVVGNDAGLIIFDPDLEQATIYNREEFLRSPAAVLSGDAESINKKYNIEQKEVKGRQIFVLREKDVDNKSFENLTFVFKKDKLISLALKDQLGQMTNIVFDKIEVNKKIDDSLFVFVAPDGADVIISR